MRKNLITFMVLLCLTTLGCLTTIVAPQVDAGPVHSGCDPDNQDDRRRTLPNETSDGTDSSTLLPEPSSPASSLLPGPMEQYYSQHRHRFHLRQAPSAIEYPPKNSQPIPKSA